MGFCQGVPFILYGFCHSHSSFYLGFATVTLHFIWLLQQLLFNLHGLCQGLLSFYMALATVTLHFIWALPQLLCIVNGLCQRVIFILYGFCKSYSSLYMALATITLHFIWLHIFRHAILQCPAGCARIGRFWPMKKNLETSPHTAQTFRD